MVGRLGATVAGMEFADDDVRTLPYAKRRLIVVDTDAAVELLRSVPPEVVRNKGPSNVGTLIATAFPNSGAGFVVGAAVQGAELLWHARMEAERVNLQYLVVSSSQAESLNFPSGPPLPRVVHVAHPGVAGTYYPAADFHEAMFNAKFAEARRILRNLGATELSVEYSEGFNRGPGVNFSVSPPAGKGVDIGGGVDLTKKVTSGAESTMKLSPTAPAQVPKDLVWFGSDPVWMDMFEARMDGTLREFTTTLEYTQDSGINGKLGRQDRRGWTGGRREVHELPRDEVEAQRKIRLEPPSSATAS